MAVPTITKTGSGSSKASGTSLAITVSTTSYALGDYVVVCFSMDPQSGAVSFAKTAGTAVIGAFVTPTGADVSSGSGTSGTRLVFALAKVTTAGTITTVTVTHPTATARSAEVLNISGADGTTPVNAANYASGGTVTPSAAGLDLALLHAVSYESPGGAAVTWSLPTQSGGTWTTAYSDATNVGTTGSGSASNIATATRVDTQVTTPAAPINTAFSSSPSGNLTFEILIQPSTTPAASLVFDERRVRRNSLLRR